MASHPRIAVYPGSFDPLTNGHVDLIKRGGRLFDRVIVALLTNTTKQPFFPIHDRLAFIREVFAGDDRVEVDRFDGLLVDYARRRGACAILRGLRNGTDLDYERQMALMNRHLNDQVDSVFLLPSAEFAHISSTLVREIASLGGSVRGLVPPAVEAGIDRRREAATRQQV